MSPIISALLSLCVACTAANPGLLATAADAQGVEAAPQSPAAAAKTAAAQADAAAAGDDGPIEDNSFLVEEAYNQEPRVVQHILAFLRSDEGSGWEAGFTQEWPVAGQRHQLSYSLSSLRIVSESGWSTGFGDAAVNYRYQLLGEGRTWISPRISLSLPTGDERDGFGQGAFGLQLNLPISVRISRSVVSHSNAGFSFTPSARNEAGDEADARATNLGQSVIWLVRPRLNLMLEAVFREITVVTGEGETDDESSAFVVPGIRWAHDFANGLQIVPGIGFPIGIGASHGDNAVFLYLSFEHPY